MEYAPPPRHGDWSSVNRHLTAGGTVEGARQENPYREYILQLIQKRMKITVCDICYKKARVEELNRWIELRSGEGMLADFENRNITRREMCSACWQRIAKILENPCGKPHNNGEETCNECLIIKEGI